MEFKPHKSFLLPDRSFQSIIKRDITKIAEALGFSETEVGKVNIIVSELTTNLLKHGATDGEFLVKPVGPDNNGLEIICLDLGPGMSDPQRMLQDGVSTTGTRGEGLGAIKRLAHEFDIFSAPGVGTIVLARLYKTPPQPGFLKDKSFEVGVVMVPKMGEIYCGDGGAMVMGTGYCRFLVADGLGHGEFAQQASQQAIAGFRQFSSLGPAETIKAMHAPMKKTRGAVVNVATLDLVKQTLTYCGVGNIAGRILAQADAGKNLISYNGILGHNIPNTINNHDLPWQQNFLLVLHSDGIKSKWDISRFRDLNRQDPSVIAAVIYKYFNRGTDDVMVVVCRTRG